MGEHLLQIRLIWRFVGSNLEDAKVLFAREASFNDFFDLKAAVYFTFRTCERHKKCIKLECWQVREDTTAFK